MLSVQLPAAQPKKRTDATLAQITQLAKSVPEIENIITVSGFSFSGSGQNMALGFVILKTGANVLLRAAMRLLFPVS